MCKYCNLLSGDSSKERHNNTFSIEINGIYYDDSESIEINYCPMCGRKIKKEDKQ